MSEPPKIKICGITRESDARKALELGADYIGIIVYDRSPRGVDLEHAAELLQSIPEGRRVCVDVNPGTDELESRLELGFDFYQLHCPLDAGLATLAAWSGLVGQERLWIAPKLPPTEPFPQVVLEFAETVVFDAYARDPLLFGGTGRTSDWARCAELATLYAHKSWVLAGGLGPDNIAAAMGAVEAAVFDVNSGVESEPGIKDETKLESLFNLWHARG